MDLLRVTDLLIDKIKRDYRDDVSLVHVHGSFVYGDTHSLSDLDMYIVPKTERGFKLGSTFILDGVGWDFWTLPWERLERIANHEERISSIITEGQALYFGSDEDEARFNALREKALSTGSGEKPAQNARKQLAAAYKTYFQMQNAHSLSEIRTCAIDMIYTISFALAELNQATIKRGRKLLKQELLAMPLVPEDFARLYDTAFLSADKEAIRAAYGALLKNTETLIAEQRKRTEAPTPFDRAFDGWYEEMIQSYNKIYHACEVGDIYTPLFASVEFSSELQDMLARSGIAPDLPDMTASYDPANLKKIAACAHEHQAAFEKLLRDNGVPVRRFNNIGELEAFLDTL